MNLNERLRHISLADLAALGLQGVGYIKLAAIDGTAAYAVFGRRRHPDRRPADARSRPRGHARERPRAGQPAVNQAAWLARDPVSSA